MEKAANIVKTMTKKKSKSSKSTKDKSRNATVQDISGPKGGSDGLYIKLMQHQRQISGQMQMINAAMDNGVKTSLTVVVTALLIQIDSAVTTTHHCLTKEICEKNDGVKTRMEECESILYCNVAKLVKWADFDSRGTGVSVDRKTVRLWIRDFELALGDIVKLVEDTQSQVSSSFCDTIQRQRRSSLGSSSSIGVQQPVEIAPQPHPQLSTVRGAAADNRERKISMPIVSTPPRLSMGAGKPPVVRDSLNSMLSESSTSDEEKRRSGSNDRVSPERHDTMMSPDWDPRNRSQTEPVFNRTGQIPLPLQPTHLPSSPIHTVTSSTTHTATDMDRSLLPPLPGEPDAPIWRSSPAHSHDQQRRGYTMPRARASESPKLNGRWSPEPGMPSQHYGSVAPGDEPPPIPVKQKNRGYQMNGQRPKREDYDDVPPPLPVKQRRGTNVTSPPLTPASTSSVHSPVHSRGQSMDSLGGERPPMVPVRLDSIIPRGALSSESAPPKPPRTDRPPVTEPPATPRTDEVAFTIRAVRRYNEDVMKGRAGPGGEEVAPPIPLKKKTIMMYKEMVQGYQFDDTIMQPLYIPMAETGPPALPPKKKNRRRQVFKAAAVGQEAHREEASPEKPSSDDQRSSMTSSVEDLADDTDAEDVNYLECEDTSGYLTFHKEEDGGYTLRGGPLDALIAYAASTTNAVKQFTEAFLLTYYTFITPEELIAKLLSRLDHFYKQRNLQVWTATTSMLVRLLNNLNQPLVQEAEIRLIEMVHQMLSDGNLKFAQLLRNALVTKLNQLIPVNSKTAPLVGPGFKSNRKFAVTDFTPEEIAKQMTVLDNELFQKVDVSEMLYWAKEQSEEKSPMLTHFTMHFNNVSQWTKTRILERGVDMRVRMKVVQHFVGIMKSLRDHFNNFNSYLAILSAIESSPVSRLDWPDKFAKSLEEPRALIDNKGSFKNYREAFARAKPPCIPYIGLYLQDLTFIEMQPKKLEDGVSINFTKRWKQFKSVDHIRFAQTKQYIFDPNPDILSLFSNFENCATDEELWTLSNEIKPSARAQRAQQQSTS